MPAKLPPEAKARIHGQHLDAIQRAVASEAIVLGMMRDATREATARLVEQTRQLRRNRDSFDQRFMVAVRDEATRLDGRLYDAVEAGRRAARDLAHGQVELELAMAEGWGKAAGYAAVWKLPVLGRSQTQAEDAVQATLATGSAVSQWSAAAVAGVAQWGRTGGAIQDAIKSTDAIMAPRLRNHAAVQAFDAYEAEHRYQWNQVIRARDDDTPRRARERFTTEEPPTDTDLGLPWGWTALSYRFWSAYLDKATCSVCYHLDGQMVPLGRHFESGYEPPVHNRCRCVVMTIFVPEQLRQRLPGIQIDYRELKAEILDAIQGRSATDRMAVDTVTNPHRWTLDNQQRSSVRYIREALGYGERGIRPTQLKSSPESLLQRLQELDAARNRARADRASARRPRLFPPPGPRGGT